MNREQPRWNEIYRRCSVREDSSTASRRNLVGPLSPFIGSGRVLYTECTSIFRLKETMRQHINRRDFLKASAGAALGMTAAGALGFTRGPKKRRPNIVLILADDMGFSDPGCYGSEISTPNLDRLAAGGLRFTQFYNTAKCCPTRATLLTGLYSHQAGVGHMVEDKGEPGYRGFLNDRCVTLAEALHGAGYFT